MRRLHCRLTGAALVAALPLVLAAGTDERTDELRRGWKHWSRRSRHRDLAGRDSTTCTDGEWQCVGMVLHRCSYGTWLNIQTCITGQTCSSVASNSGSVVGCIWASNGSVATAAASATTVIYGASATTSGSVSTNLVTHELAAGITSRSAVLTSSSTVTSSITTSSSVSVVSAATSAVSTTSSTSGSGIYTAPHYVLYSDQWITQPPDPTTIASYNRYLLSFWTPAGLADNVHGWTLLDSSTRSSVIQQYHAAGMAFMMSAFGSTSIPTTAGNDSVETATQLAAFVKEWGFDGVDIDYEDFAAMDGGTAEAWLISFQTELRKLLPPPYIITHAPVAPWFFASSYTNGGGGYAYVHEKVGSGIDWYNVQFYSQSPTQYTDCESLLYTAQSKTPNSALFQITDQAGVPLEKLVIGKVLDSSILGYMAPSTLAGCLTQAKAKGWNAGVMVWQYLPASATLAQSFMSTALGG